MTKHQNTSRIINIDTNSRYSMFKDLKQKDHGVLPQTPTKAPPSKSFSTSQAACPVTKALGLSWHRLGVFIKNGGRFSPSLGSLSTQPILPMKNAQTDHLKQKRTRKCLVSSCQMVVLGLNTEPKGHHCKADPTPAIEGLWKPMAALEVKGFDCKVFQCARKINTFSTNLFQIVNKFPTNFPMVKNPTQWTNWCFFLRHTM